MTDLRFQHSLRSRAIGGLSEGAAWGGTIGLIRGAIALLRNDTPWYVQLGGSVLVGIVVGSVICCIGRSLSGKLGGAWIGAVAGLFAGLFIGDILGGYRWTTIDESGGTATAVGQPVGQMTGSAIGAIVGAVFGALADRFIRPVEETTTQSSA